jgi:hypothetical protein
MLKMLRTRHEKYVVSEITYSDRLFYAAFCNKLDSMARQKEYEQNKIESDLIKKIIEKH